MSSEKMKKKEHRKEDESDRERKKENGARSFLENSLHKMEALSRQAGKLRESSQKQIRQIAAGMIRKESDDDPIVTVVENRKYASWKRAWTGTIRSNARPRGRHGGL